MSPDSNEAGMLESSRLRKNHRVVAEPKVPHGSDNRQTGGLRGAEPHAGESTVPPESDDVAAVRDYWTAAKARYKRGDFPDYGTPAWCDLPIEDPRKMAGLVAFAQMWRKYGDEIATDLNRQLAYHEPVWNYPTLAERDQAHQDMLARARRSNEREAA